MSTHTTHTDVTAVEGSAQRHWVALGTIARREIVRILRIWGQTLVPPAITMTLYFLIFGGLIGSKIGDMGGYSYMQFIVPGLVMMSVIQNSYGNISSSFFGAKFGRHIEELMVSPMPSWVILTGYVTGGISPLGQRTRVPTFIDSSAQDHEKILVSGGKRTLSVSIAPTVLAALSGATFSSISDPSRHS